MLRVVNHVRARVAAAALALTGALVFAGCSADEPGSTRESLLEVWTATGRTASAFQEGIIADGVITEAEYLSAVDAAARCMEDKGWEVGKPSPRPDGITYDFATGATGGDLETEPERNQIDYNECADGTIDPLEMAYFEANLFTGEERERAYRELAECLAANGVDGVVDGATLSEVSILLQEADASDAAHMCVDRSGRLFSNLSGD